MNGNKIIEGVSKETKVTTAGYLAVYCSDVAFKNITINSNYTPCNNSAIKVIYLMGQCNNATFDNVHVESLNTNGNPRGIQIDEVGATNKMILNMKDSSIEVGRSGYAIRDFRKSDITLTGVTIGGYAAVYFYNCYEEEDKIENPSGSTVTATGCTFNAINYQPKGENDFSVFNFDGDDYSTMNCNVTLDNCMVNGYTAEGAESITSLVCTQWTGEDEKGLYATVAAANLTFTVKGDSIVNCGNLVNEDNTCDDLNNIQFQEGTYYQDPSNYVDKDSYKIIESKDSKGVKIWVVSKK